MDGRGMNAKSYELTCQKNDSDLAGSCASLCLLALGRFDLLVLPVL